MALDCQRRRRRKERRSLGAFFAPVALVTPALSLYAGLPGPVMDNNGIKEMLYKQEREREKVRGRRLANKNT